MSHELFTKKLYLPGVGGGDGDCGMVDRWTVKPYDSGCGRTKEKKAAAAAAVECAHDSEPLPAGAATGKAKPHIVSGDGESIAHNIVPCGHDGVQFAEFLLRLLSSSTHFSVHARRRLKHSHSLDTCRHQRLKYLRFVCPFPLLFSTVLCSHCLARLLAGWPPHCGHHDVVDEDDKTQKETCVPACPPVCLPAFCLLPLCVSAFT